MYQNEQDCKSLALILLTMTFWFLAHPPCVSAYKNCNWSYLALFLFEETENKKKIYMWVMITWSWVLQVLNNFTLKPISLFRVRVLYVMFFLRCKVSQFQQIVLPDSRSFVFFLLKLDLINVCVFNCIWVDSIDEFSAIFFLS